MEDATTMHDAPMATFANSDRPRIQCIRQQYPRHRGRHLYRISERNNYRMQCVASIQVPKQCEFMVAAKILFQEFCCRWFKEQIWLAQALSFPSISLHPNKC
jgi:hypothetical protein